MKAENLEKQTGAKFSTNLSKNKRVMNVKKICHHKIQVNLKLALRSVDCDVVILNLNLLTNLIFLNFNFNNLNLLTTKHHNNDST